MEHSKYQVEIFKTFQETNKNIVISAVPGSGKTTTLLELLKFIPNGRKSIFLAFNKSIVEELVEKASRINPSVKVMTLHSLGLRCLYPIKHNLKVKENKTITLIYELFKKHISTIKIPIIIELWDLYRMNLCNSREELEKIALYYGCDFDNPNLDFLFETFIPRVEKYNLDGDIMVDFIDMLYLPIIFEHSIEFDQYTDLFIDECQDLSIIQQRLIWKIKHPKGRFVAVGDRNQAIYSFLGADINAFKNFQSQENTVSLPLSVSYRCPRILVEQANGIYETIECHPKAIQGELLEGDLLDAQAGDFIICRNNRPLFVAYLFLLKNRKKCFIKGLDLEKKLLNLITEIQNYKKKNSFVEIKDIQKVFLDNIKKLLVEKGVSEPTKHKKYQELLENFQILQHLLLHFGDFERVKKAFKEMFMETKDGICLSTIHKVKGLESNTVLLLMPNLMPSKYANLPWEMEQERNLLYVALTRAKQKLIILKENF